MIFEMAHFLRHFYYKYTYSMTSFVVCQDLGMSLAFV